MPTLRTVRKLGKPFAFVLNQTPPRGGRIGEAAMALNSAGALALPYVVQRIDHQDALGAGFGVTEFAPDSKAAAEIRELWRWVWQTLELQILESQTLESDDHERTVARAAG